MKIPSKISAKSIVLFKPSECMGNPYFNMVLEIKVSPPSSTCKTLSSSPIKINKNEKLRRNVIARWDLKINRIDVTLRSHILGS